MLARRSPARVEYGWILIAPALALVSRIGRRRAPPARGRARGFARGLEHGIGDRADVGMDPLQVAQDVQMQPAGLDAFGAAFAQPPQVTLGGGDFGLALVAFVLHYFTVWLAEAELLSAPWLLIIALVAALWLTPAAPPGPTRRTRIPGAMRERLPACATATSA